MTNRSPKKKKTERRSGTPKYLDVPVLDPVAGEPAVVVVVGRQVKTYLALEGLQNR